MLHPASRDAGFDPAGDDGNTRAAAKPDATEGAAPMGRTNVTALRLRRAIAGGFLLLALVLATTECVGFYFSLQRAEESAKRHAEALALALEQRAARVFGDADALLLGVRGAVEKAGGVGAIDEPRLGRLLATLHARAAAAPNPVVIKPSGRMIVGGDFAAVAGEAIDARLLSLHRDDPANGIAISVATAAKGSSAKAVILSRRLVGQDGSFAGVVAASLTADVLEGLDASPHALSTTRLSLYRRDDSSLLMYRGPDDGNSDLSDEKGGGPGLKGGGKAAAAADASYALAMRSLRDLPLLAVAGVPRDEVVRAWSLDGLGRLLQVGVVLVASLLVLRRISGARRELDDSHAALAAALDQRDGALQRAHGELESFRHAIAHDLRTPLRAINGYAQIVLREHSTQLDAQARQYLARVENSALRMAELIDGLQELARLARRTVSPGEINLSSMVEELLQEFQAREPQRRVHTTVAECLHAEGDGALVRNLLRNLLSNAWKYTAGRSEAHIEIGARRANGEQVFFVRDDGAGFDMAHARKLFGTFQRLHNATEFPGLGIGLALAHRIVSLHGGRIWAEGAPQQGATFCFTLAPRANGRPAAQPEAERQTRSS